MSTAIAIIGANYGDEGKGLATDYFCRNVENPVVVRFNGGAQAGHTVVDGAARHVFGHIGAGSFAGARTFLSKAFILNPILFAKELNDLGFDVDVTHDPACRVTTPYDIAIGRLAELWRGDARHGSCGLGINETVTRTLAGFPCRLGSSLREDLTKIQRDWIPVRFKQLGLPMEREAWSHVIAGWKQLEIFFNMLATDPSHYAGAIERASVKLQARTPSHTNETVIFEGAQGLGLDEYLGEFPHVTRSITGLVGALAAAPGLGVKEVQPFYMTRAFLTRHGNGPLEGAQHPITSTKLYDHTNAPNDWQGTLRYAPLDLDILADRIQRDIRRAEITAHVQQIRLLPAKVFLTHLDMVGETIHIVRNGELREISTLALRENFLRVGLDVAYTSHGPEAKDVHRYQF